MPYSLEENQFILESYFRNGQRNENGEWIYSVQLCVEEVMDHFPNRDFDYDNLSRLVHRVVDRVRKTGSVEQGKSSGRTTVLTEDVLEDIRTRMQQSPKKSLRKLSQQTGAFK